MANATKRKPKVLWACVKGLSTLGSGGLPARSALEALGEFLGAGRDLGPWGTREKARIDVERARRLVGSWLEVGA